MRGYLNRRKLIGLMAWLLPGRAITKLLAQQPASGKSESIHFGEPTMGGFLKGNDFRQRSEAGENRVPDGRMGRLYVRASNWRQG